MNKIEALRTLGFKFITRDINGTLTGWVNIPKRVIYCLETMEEYYKKKYPDAIIYTTEKDEDDEEIEWKDGIYLSCTGYERTDSVDLNTIIHLKNDNEYNNISWEGGIVEITENGYTDKFEALKTLGFNFITRDLDGNIIAHKHTPTRIIYCRSIYESIFKEKYPSAIIEVDDTYDDFQNGMSQSMSCWQSGKAGDYHFSYFLDLPDIKDYENIVWKKEPFVL